MNKKYRTRVSSCTGFLLFLRSFFCRNELTRCLNFPINQYIEHLLNLCTDKEDKRKEHSVTQVRLNFNDNFKFLAFLLADIMSICCKIEHMPSHLPI